MTKEEALKVIKREFCLKAGISENDHEVVVVVMSESIRDRGLHNYTQLDGGDIYCYHDKDVFSEIRLAATHSEDIIEGD